jgi:RimK family alpha-L-glutamate ligase
VVSGSRFAPFPDAGPRGAAEDECVNPTGSRVIVLGRADNETNVQLVAAWSAQGLACAVVDPYELRPEAHDVVLARLDVLPTLDGVEPGLLQLLFAQRRGATVLNRTESLLTTHDKLRTAAALERAGLPHPRTRHLRYGQIESPPGAPVVLKPRFGSWGRDVRLCRTDAEVLDALREFRSRGWFRRHGVLAQEVIPTRGFDLRVLVADGRVVGAIERHPQPGEWRTNVSVGASARPAVPNEAACKLAVAAAGAAGADLVGVDLMSRLDGSYVVIELNGAADFDPGYVIGGDIYAEVADALRLPIPAPRAGSGLGEKGRENAA